MPRLPQIRMLRNAKHCASVAPPRPLKPDASQITPASSQNMPPAWSTAVTQPMQNPRPRTGTMTPGAARDEEAGGLTGDLRAKTCSPLVLPTPETPRPAAPPMSGTRPKTARLGEAIAPPLAGGGPVLPATSKVDSGAYPRSHSLQPDASARDCGQSGGQGFCQQRQS